MKKFFSGFLAVILLFVFLNINICAHIKPDDVSITDYSGIISGGVKDYVKSKNAVLFGHTEAKIIFVTTDSTDGLNLNEYAKNLYSSWNISNMGRGNSVLIVMDPNAKDYGIIQSKNIKRALTDDILYEILARDFEPYFAQADYDNAVLSLYNGIGRWYEQNYNGLNLGLSDDFDNYKTGEKVADADIKPNKLWLWIGMGVIALVVIIFFNIKRRIDFRARQHQRRIKRKRSKADIDKIVNS